MDDVITEIAPDDDLFLPPATTTARTLNKFQPKPCGKPKKRIATALNPHVVTSDAGAVPEEPFSTGKGNPGQDATVAECTESVVVPITEPSSAAAPIAGSSQLSLVEEAAHVIGAPEVDTEVQTAFDMEDDPLFNPSGPTEQAVGKFRPKRHPKTTQSTPSSSNSDDNTLHHSSPTGDIDAANLSSVSCETMNFSSHVIETQESVNIAKGSSNHDWNCQDGPEVFENENNLQTDTDKPEEEAMPVPSGMESHDLLSPPSDTAVKQTSKFQPKFASRPRKQKAKSVSFSLPDAATTAASPVRDHSDVLADNSTGTEVSSIQMMHDESVDNLLHTTSVISDIVTIQLDQGDARNEVLTDLSGHESFDSILPELCSVTGKTVPKFRPKRGAKSKTLKLNSSSDTNSAKEYTPSQWDSVSMDADPLTNLANEQTEPVERLPIEAGSPGGNEVFETIDTPLDRDSYIVGKEKLSVGSEDTGNEVQFWNEEEQTHNPSQEHEAGKSLRKLRKRVAAGSPGKLDDGISENSNYSQMDEYHDDDENRGVPKQRKQPKRSKRQTTDAQKPPKRHRKTSKDPESTKTEPPKKRFPHGIRRGRRQVDKALLEASEYEDRTQIVLRQLIRLGEANERNASKEVATLKNNQSNNGSFSNGINIDPNNPYDEDLDPYGEEAHRNMLRNSRKLNYHTHMPKPQRRKWSKSETESFYEAIRQFGTDFGMIEKLFPNRTRHQVKLKFKNEERKHPAELHDAMSHRSKDLSHFEKVIQQLKAEAEESRPDDANDAVDVNEEERDDQPEIEPEKEEHEANGFDGKATDSGKHDEWDADGTTDYNEYESVDWDVGASSSQNEEKYAEYDEFY